ncbi:MAG: diflavin oxidoreductase, partial [Frankia sp.]
GHGRRLDHRLDELGAARLVPRVDCEPDYDTNAGRWLDTVLAALAVTDPDPPHPDRDTANPDSPGPTGTTAPGGRATTAGTAVPTAGRAAPTATRPTKASPATAHLVGNRLLSRPGSDKEVRHFAFDTTGSALAYEAGDALGVWPVNCPDLVTEWLAATGADPTGTVTLPGLGDVPFAEALHRHLDMTKVTPSLLTFVADRAGDRGLKTLLRPDNTDELAKWSWGRQAVDVLAEFGVRAAAQEWADVLRRLQPRQYSISSSPLTHPDQIHLTVSVVRYDSRGGRPRKGVCSTYLADAEPGRPVPVFVQRSATFRPPADPNTPMIMVGPGTGIAPFLGFLHDRQARGAGGRNWLLFGEQRQATDFYYAEELAALRDAGILTRLDLAFSRDQRTKVYVQDRMREHGAQLWSWLCDGAHFYVCGDATRMAADVDQTLREIVTTHGRLDADQAAAYVRQLAADKRYLRDVY